MSLGQRFLFNSLMTIEQGLPATGVNILQHQVILPLIVPLSIVEIDEVTDTGL